MYDSVKKTKVQPSQDIFTVEVWGLRAKNRDGDALLKGEITPRLLLVWRGESAGGQEG